LCEFINKLQPGSVKKINESTQNWHQLENIGNFIKAITKYGVKPHDIFEPGLGMEHCDTLNVSLQMGSNKGASQRGMTVYGLPRQVYDPKYCLTPEYPELGEPAHNHHAHNYYNSA
ncbi:CNN1 isoform 5, partial [Pan troglodytes]